jgi:VanZ family protein
MSTLARRSLTWSTVALWAGVIFYFSSIPGSDVPGIVPAPVAHFCEYFILGALLYSALRIDLSPRAAFIWAVAIASAYAVSDEFHQHFVVMRTPDPLDWVVDTLGAAAGAGTAHTLLRRLMRGRSA